MTNALAIRDDMSLSEIGNVLVKSGFFGDSRDASQAIVKVLAGRELGFGPIASMVGVNIIKGRVSLSANLLAAAIIRSKKYTYRIATPLEKRNQECELVFFELSGAGAKEELGRARFTMEDAKRAGLSGDNWQKYPANMLFARAISNGAKWYCPDVFGGPIYTPDELGAAVDGETGEVIEATITDVPAQPAQPAQPPAMDPKLAKGWEKWRELEAQAEAAGMDLDGVPALDGNWTLDELRQAYKEFKAGFDAYQAAQS